MAKSSIIPPDDLKDYLEIESEEDFPINRYYATKTQKDLIKSIVETKRVSEQMRELGLPYLNSTLLSGKPGNGKTTFARYTAYTLGLDLIYLNFATIGRGPEAPHRIHNIFRFVADKKCVFLLDEIDSVGKKRIADATSDNDALTNAVMQELDFYKTHPINCIILGATNRLDILDAAVLSRFAVKIEMPTLNNQEKREYIDKFLTDLDIPHNLDNIARYVDDNNTEQQRTVESDMIRCIADWLKNNKEKPYFINHMTERGIKQYMPPIKASIAVTIDDYVEDVPVLITSEIVGDESLYTAVLEQNRNGIRATGKGESIDEALSKLGNAVERYFEELDL